MINHNDRYAALTSLESVLAILNAVNDAICIYDASGKIVLVNDGFAKLTGFSRQELEGLDVRSLFLKEDGTPILPHEQPFLLQESQQKRRCRISKKGESIVLSARATQLIEEGLVLVCITSLEQNAKDIDAYPLSPSALAQDVREASVLDLFSTENLSRLLSLATGNEHKRAERVQVAAEELWIKLHSLQLTPTREEYQEAISELAAVMHCEIWDVELAKNALQSTATDVAGKACPFPFTFDELKKEASHGAVKLILPEENLELSAWLESLDPKQTGFLVLMSPNSQQAPYDFLVLRDFEKYGPLDTLEITFFKRFVQNIYHDERYANQQAQDTYISQTLQLGMGNRLHEVEGLETAALYNSATALAQIGGDFYTVMQVAPHTACIILGDVTGKGVAAASVSSALKTALVAYAWEGQTPSYIARAVNDFFLGFSRLETFATVFIGILDTEDGTLSYCSAGHLPALIARKETKEIEQLTTQSGVVGAFSEMIYVDGHATLAPHDTLLLYTDGVTEARNAQGEFYGEDRLRRTLASVQKLGAKRIPDAILQSILQYTDAKLDDDIALLAAEIVSANNG